MFKLFAFTPQARTSNSFSENETHNHNDRRASVIANCHVAADFTFWKATGDSSVVDDEAEGFRGTRGQRKETNIIYPL